MKPTKVMGERFSKTLSLPVQTWSHLEEVRSMTRWPDLSIALVDCIDSKYEALILVKKMEQTQLKDSQNLESK